MEYKVLLSADAVSDLEKCIQYLVVEKANFQAAKSVLNDFEDTKRSLEISAGSLSKCKNPKLKRLGYYRINFHSHNYFMLYRISNNTVIVDKIFHFLEDYENKMY